MSCEECEKTKEIDGIDPDCTTEKGCIIPPLGARERRILDLRDRILSLRGLVEAGTILRMHRATIDDLKLLASIEDEYKEING